MRETRTGAITKILLTFKERVDEHLLPLDKKIRENNKTYATSVADDMNKQLIKEYSFKLEEIRGIYRKILNERMGMIISAEKERVLKPLSESESAYLRDMSRSKNVTVVEFNTMVEKYKDNYSAVKILEDIAKENGIAFHIIHLDLKLSKAEEVREYAMGVIGKYGALTDALDMKSAYAFDGILEYDMDIVTGPYIPEENKFEKDYK